MDKKLLLVAAILFVAALAFGCTQKGAPSATAMPGTQLANPASVNCVNIGGTLSIRADASGGQYGMCVFANGTECEEWALFRGEGCKAGVSAAPTATVSADAALDSALGLDVGSNPDTGTESALPVSDTEP